MSITSARGFLPAARPKRLPLSGWFLLRLDRHTVRLSHSAHLIYGARRETLPSMPRTMTSRSVLLAIPAVIALSQGSAARADDILVYQTQNNDPFMGDTAGPNAAAILTGLGHNVTSNISLGATLPADLSSFDSIWVIQLVQLTGVQQTQLVQYVKGGGGLYLTGERSCCENVNAGVQFMLNQLTPDITQIGGLGEGGDDFAAVANDTWSITTTPNPVPTWLAGQAGLADNIPANNQVYNHPNTLTGAAAWAGEELDHAGGCIYVAMDLSWWFTTVHPEQDKEPLTENIQTFLGSCADSDGDGASDVAEEAAGTDPDDPDSDDDGLCDGYGTVSGVCVPGESVFEDNDKDGDIDPLDDDDDNDGIPTLYEVGAEAAAPDVDDDNTPAWLDVDSDENNIPDSVEGEHDFDNDGIPSIVDLDDNPDNCDEDEDCLPPQGPVCDQRSGFCSDGEGGGNQGGNGPGGSSGDGGNGNTGAGSANGGNGNGVGGDNNSSGSGNNESDGGAGADGCDCSTPGRAANSAGYAALLAMLLLGRRKKRS
jgi:uncharacterized membrane protein YgcG